MDGKQVVEEVALVLLVLMLWVVVLVTDKMDNLEDLEVMEKHTQLLTEQLQFITLVVEEVPLEVYLVVQVVKVEVVVDLVQVELDKLELPIEVGEQVRHKMVLIQQAVKVL